ncbi:phage tail tape measure protein [Vibrio porteresiae]|uniref:Phage tail tape measure protein n=1 Tax=Vibrio porteresiae DSM 19223 TaxID=1123496 RepID=A0ABZ0QBJ1_9VIBR|nr:phage tail tape measure protein [Vibrio porteresiae]WPC72918.1 phage tail tape measure protein [Vibrio porteresiae DSM 19223]
MASRSLGNLTVNMVLNTGSFTEGAGRAERALERTEKAAKKQRDELSRLIGQIDPVVAEYDRLDKMEEKLRKHRKEGTLSQDDFDGYIEKLQEMRAGVDGSAAASKRLQAEQEKQIAQTRELVASLDPYSTKLAEIDAKQAQLSSGFASGIVSQDELTKGSAKLKLMREEIDGTAAAQRQAEKATQDQVKELNRLSAALDPVSHELNNIASSQALLKKSLSDGLIDQNQFSKLNSQLEANKKHIIENSAAYDKSAKSAKEMQFALRGLPAQFTDIVVSLQGGQQPLTVLLQQGGQLKDMFGGIGPAARAMAGYIVGLINPYTLAAAAGVGLAVAYYQGTKEADKYRNALILTGNAAGATVSDLQNMAKRIDAVSGTQHNAAAVIAEVASTGKFTAQQIESVSLAAIQMESATGKAVSETIAEFTKLSKDPVKAIEDLNENQNFLTASVYEQIQSLKSQGKEQEAVTLAFKTYQETISERTTKINGDLGEIEKKWKQIKSATAEAWDGVLDVFRKETTEQQLDAVNQKIASNLKALQETESLLASGDKYKLNSGDGLTSYTIVNLSDRKAQLEQELELNKAKKSKLELDVKENQKQAEFNELNAKAIEAMKEVEKLKNDTLTKDEKRNKALKDYKDNLEAIRLVNPDSKLLDPELVSKTTKAINDRFKPTKATEDAATKMLQSLREQESVFNEQLSTNTKLASSRETLAKFEQKIADIKSKQTLTADQKSLLASEDAIRSQLQKNIAVENEIKLKEQLSRTQNMQSAADATLAAEMAKYSDALANQGLDGDQNKQLKDELSIRKDIAKQIQAATSDQVSGKISQEELDKQKSILQKSLSDRLEANRDYYAQVDEYESDWTNGFQAAMKDYVNESRKAATISKQFFTGMFNEMADTIADFALTGKASFKDFADAIIKDMVRIASQQAAAGLLSSATSAIGSLFTTPAPGVDYSAGMGASIDVGSIGPMYSTGGYTGAGGKYEPAGIVHKGEVVWSQDDVNRAGGVGIVEAMRKGMSGYTSGLTGYASGGVVGSAIGSSSASSSGQSSSVVIQQQINVSDSESSNNDSQGLAKAYADSARAGAKAEIAKQLQPGGTIWRAMKGR